MPGPYSAGTIFLQIVPSFRGVPEEIAREGREIARQLGRQLDEETEKGTASGIKKGIEKGAKDAKGATAKAGKEAGEEYASNFRKSMGDGVAKMQRELGKIKIDVDDRAAQRKFDSLKKAAENLGTDIKMGADSGLVFKEFQRILHRIEDIHDAAENIEFRSNIGGVIKDARKVHAAISDLNRLDIEPDLKIDKQLGAFERKLKAGVKSILDDIPPVKVDVELTDAQQEVEKLRTQLLSIGDIDLDVDLNSALAMSKLVAVERELENIADKAASPKLRMDAREALRDARNLRQELEDAANVRIHPELELNEGDFQRDVRQAMEKAVAAIGDLEIDLELADDATADIQRLKREIETLSGKKIGIDFGAATALAEAERLEEELDKISRDRTASFDVRSNAAVAASQLRALREEADKLDGRDLNLDVDTSGIKDLDRSLTKLGNTQRQIRDEMDRTGTRAQDNANSFRAFNIRILGVAAVGPAIIPMLAAVAGGLLAIGPLAVAGAAGLGVLGAALFGIGDAFKAMGDVQRNSAKDAEAYADGVRTASNGVRDAERGLADARSQAARSTRDSQEAVSSALEGVADAERNLADARESAAQANAQAARQVEQASRGVRQAEENVADAQRDAQEAQEDLAQARRDAAEDYEDLQLSLRGGALAERDAVFDIADAEEDLREARAKGTADDIARAQLKLEQELLGLDVVRERNGDLAQEQDKWARDGVEGSDRVVSARERVASADEAIRDAQQGLRDAQQAVADARIEQSRTAIQGSRQIADAERGVVDAQKEVANARRDAAEATVDSQRQIADAQIALADAQLRYQDALDETSTSQQKFMETMANLGPAGQAFVTYLDSLRKPMLELRGIAQEGVLPGLQSWIDSMVGYHGPLLRSTVEGISGAVGDMFEAFGQSFKGDSFTRLFQMINDSGPRFIGYLSDTLVNLGEGFADLIVAAEPLADIFGVYLVNAATRFNDAMDDIGETNGFKEFTKYFERILPEVEAFFSALTRAIVNLAVAMAPYAEALMNVLTGVLDFIAGMDPAILGPIASGLFILVTGLQAIFGITSAMVSVKVAAHIIGIGDAATLSAFGIGGVVRQMGFLVGAATLVGGALVLLYASNEDFRDSVNKLFTALGDVVGAMWDIAGPVAEAMLGILGVTADLIGDTLAPVLDTLADLLSDNAQLIGTVLTAFIAWRVVGTIIGGVTAAVGLLATAFGRLAAAQAIAGWGGMAGALRGGAAAAAGPASLAKKAGAVGIGLAGIGLLTSQIGGETDYKPDLGSGLSGGIARFDRGLTGMFGDYRTSTDDVQKVSEAILKGGETAAQAEEKYRRAQDEANNALKSTWNNLDFWNESASDRVEEYEGARTAAHDYYYSLDELGRAQASQAQWAETLKYRVAEYGPAAEETIIAQERLKYWTGEVAAAQENQAEKTESATVAIERQRDVIRGQYESQFAYEQAIRGVGDAHKALEEAYAMAQGTDEEKAARERAIRDALVGVESATYGAAQAAEARAQERYANLPQAERDRLAQAALVVELDRQKAAYGELPPKLQALRDELGRTISPADLLRVKFDDLGVAVSDVPDDKTIVIASDTAGEKLQQMRDLGFTVEELPDGRFKVTAATQEAEDALKLLTRDREVNVTARWNIQNPGVKGERRTAVSGGGVQGGSGQGPRPPRAAGGAIFGPGTGTSDSILARVSNGEYVIRAAAVKQYGLGFLNAVNWQQYRDGGLVGAALPRFADGGYVANIGAAVNISDMTGIGQMFLDGMNQAQSIVNQGAANIGGIFGRLRDDVNSRSRETADGANGWFSNLRDRLVGRSAETRDGTNGLFGELRDNLGNRSREAADGADGWFGNLRDRLLGRSGETRDGANGIFGQLRDLLADRTRETADNADGWFTNLRDRLFGRSTETRDNTNVLFSQMRDDMTTRSGEAVLNVAGNFNKIPGSTASPVNTMIDKVLNNGLFSSFNSIVGSLGLDEKLKIAPSPTVRLATGGRVPGYSPTRTADNIPAMLTAGEWVQPVDSVQYYGPQIMEAIRKKRIPREVFMGGAEPIHRAQGGLVALGRRFQQMGARVAEHPAFPPLSMTGHGKTSLHYTGHAIDVNTRPGTSALEQRELRPLEQLARSLGFRTIFMAPDHYNHLHVDDGGGASIGGGFSGIFDIIANAGRSLRDTVGKLLEGFETTQITKIMGAGTRKLADKMAEKVDALSSTVGDFGSTAAFEGGQSSSPGNEALVQQMAAGRGWTGAEWSALRTLIMKESGFNNVAQNPTSTAYGMFQFLNSTWGGVGAQKTSDPRLQTEAGFRYIASRYGTPSRALAFHRANNWYSEGGEVTEITPSLNDMGSVLNPGVHVLANKTRQPEVMLPITPGQLENLVAASERGFGGPMIGELNLPLMTQATPESVASEVVHKINVVSRGGKYGRS